MFSCRHVMEKELNVKRNVSRHTYIHTSAVLIISYCHLERSGNYNYSLTLVFGEFQGHL